MSKSRYLQKYIGVPVFATSLLVSPLFVGTASASGDATFSVGDNGSDINTLQSDLTNQGFNTGTDGVFGNDTKQAVMDFQKENGLQVDGVAGKNTLIALSGGTSSNTSNTALLQMGSSNSQVEEAQSKLNNHGYDIAIDGIFGSATQSAVKSFQSESNIQVDGIVGNDTLNALNNGADVPAESPSDSPAETPSETPSDSSQASNDVTAIAQDLVGSPYTFGGNSPAGFDSSGFINYVFAQVGVDLDRTHADMWNNNGHMVSQPSPGDVVFFENTYQPGISHSGIYLGNNQMVHAGTSNTGVEVTSMDIDYWSSRYVGAKSMQ